MVTAAEGDEKVFYHPPVAQNAPLEVARLQQHASATDALLMSRCFHGLVRQNLDELRKRRGTRATIPPAEGEQCQLPARAHARVFVYRQRVDVILPEKREKKGEKKNATVSSILEIDCTTQAWSCILRYFTGILLLVLSHDAEGRASIALCATHKCDKCETQKMYIS